MKYLVRIGDDDHEAVIDGDSVTYDGETLRAHAEELSGTPVRLVTVGSNVHRVVARRGEQRGQYELSIGGFRFNVQALDERTRAIRELSDAATAPAGPVHLRAPMPGLIVRVNVAAGDLVRAGQGLVVMEAMKMENELRATANGSVKRVLVDSGSVVEKGAMLLELE